MKRESERERSMSCPRGVHSYPDDPPERILFSGILRMCDSPSVRGYIRVTSDAFRKSSREMRRVAQPRKKRALLGNIHGSAYMYVHMYEKSGKERECMCAYIVGVCARAPWAA